MARIAGVDIPNDKRVVISLTYVYGIGLATSKKILAAAGISEDVRVRDLTSDQEDAIRREVDAIKVEGDLRREVNLNIKRLMEIGSLPWYSFTVVDFLSVDKTLKTTLALVKVKLLRLLVRKNNIGGKSLG